MTPLIDMLPAPLICEKYYNDCRYIDRDDDIISWFDTLETLHGLSAALSRHEEGSLCTLAKANPRLRKIDLSL